MHVSRQLNAVRRPANSFDDIRLEVTITGRRFLLADAG
jgi:hypothetical protein